MSFQEGKFSVPLEIINDKALIHDIIHYAKHLGIEGLYCGVL